MRLPPHLRSAFALLERQIVGGIDLLDAANTAGSRQPAASSGTSLAFAPPVAWTANCVR